MTCERRFVGEGGGSGALLARQQCGVRGVGVGVSSAGSGRGGASVGASSWSPRRGHRRAASRRDATTSSSLLFSSRRCYDATPWLAGWRRPSARLVAPSPDHNSSRLIAPRFDALCPLGRLLNNNRHVCLCLSFLASLFSSGGGRGAQGRNILELNQ